MVQAKVGDKVLVHYEGSFDDGTVFDSSADQEPLEIVLGQGMVIPGFEAAIIGMNEGEKCRVTLEPEQGYGPHRDDLIKVIDRTDLPEDIQPEVGLLLRAYTQDGEEVNVTVVEVDDDTVTLDANHPLAGKNISFEIQLVQVG